MMGTVERREKDKQRMRKRILDTAMRLFLKEGFERVTLRAIAREIEYSPATIYLYFKDKNEILYALQTIGFEKLYEKQQEVLTSQDPWKNLRLLARSYITFALKNPAYYDLMFIMRGPIKKMKEKKKWEEGLRSYDLLKTNVSASMQAGYLPKGDIDVATFAFWSFTHGMVSLVIRDRTIMIPESRLHHILEQAAGFVMESMAQSR